MLNTIKVVQMFSSQQDNKNIDTSDNIERLLVEVILLQEEVTEILRKTIGNQDIDYLNAILMLAYFYKLNNNNDKFESLCIEIINLCEKDISIREVRSHHAALSILGQYYLEGNEMSKGLAIALKSLQLLRQDRYHARMASFKNFQSNIYLLLINGYLDEGKELMELAVEISKDRLHSNISNIEIENQRDLYWDSDANQLFSAFQFHNLILNSGTILYNLSLLNKCAKLYFYSNKDSFDLFSVSWENIEQTLAKNEIAIEFIRVIPEYLVLNGAPYYIALTLKNGDSEPAISYLCSEEELLSNSITPIQLRDRIWGRLMDRLSNVNTIYFSPMGEINNLPIEVLPDFNGRGIMNDRFNIFRLSSTRCLVQSKSEGSSKEVVIYGGLRFDTDIENMEKEAQFYSQTSCRGRSKDIEYEILDSLRKGVNYLKYTKIEAEEIAKLMDEAHLCSLLLTGSNGNEESFKNLSGKRKSIIHISTHGFYWNKEEATSKALLNDNLKFILDFEELENLNAGVGTLARTGLLLAGANNSLKGLQLPNGIDDGILTAQEISKLDLQGLDLVVLSACKTGVGEITGEGVYGLQRGFKKAGANSILMSLWDVDDEATQLLMKEFYKNYLNGMAKHRALQAAQKAVRETPGFEDPEYWAAFILLDALN